MRCNMRAWVGPVGVVALLLLAGCGDDGGGSAADASSDASDASGSDVGGDTADDVQGDAASDTTDTTLADGAGTDGASTDGAGADGTSDADASSDADTVEPPPTYAASIQRTSYGVPHVTANSWGDLGFGHGYVYAQDHVCILADQILRANGERAKYFGAGESNANINSDFAMLALGNQRLAAEAIDDMDADVRALINGYVAGYNHFLEVTPKEQIPADCRDAEWLQPLTELRYLAYLHMVVLYASGTNLTTLIATAQAPGFEGKAPDDDTGKGIQWPVFDDAMGSNGWGIGSDKTEGGTGMLVVNPHFPWQGERKFSEVHLTIPGVYDVYGTALMGAPLVTIGFNRHLGWTHTVTTSKHFTFYQLDLDPEDPTKYLFDGESRDIESEVYTIDVLEDGQVKSLERTLWHTHWGPMLNVPPFGWSASLGLTYRDSNVNNFRAIPQWMELGLATNLDEFRDALARHQGIPWVNTMYADDQGNAFYADATPVPNLSQATLDAYEIAVEEDFFTKQAAASGIVLLDGSTSQNEWVDEEGAAVPGVIPFADAPQLVRADFVANANDSHWLTNPAAPLVGYSPMWGDERAPRSPRTRHNLMMLTESGEGTASGADGKFSLDELAAAILSQRSLTADLLLDAAVARCTETPEVTIDEEVIDLTAACQVLSDWTGRSTVDQAGPPVWRETMGSFKGAEIVDAGELWATTFDADDPVNTPSGLAEEDSHGILVAMAEAVTRLQDAGYSVDSPLGDMQFAKKGEETIAIPGGPGFPEGTFNVVQVTNGNNTLYPSIEIGDVINPATGLSDEGYVIRYGSSTVMTVEFTADGPVAKAILTYSQSSDPSSEHYADQTKLFTTSTLRDVRFTASSIAADPNLQTFEITNAP